MPDAEQVPDLMRDDCTDQVVVPRHRKQRVGAESSASRQSKCHAGQAGDRHNHGPCRVACAVSGQTAVLAAVLPIARRKDDDDLVRWPVRDRTRLRRVAHDAMPRRVRPTPTVAARRPTRAVSSRHPPGCRRRPGRATRPYPDSRSSSGPRPPPGLQASARPYRPPLAHDGRARIRSARLPGPRTRFRVGGS